MAGYGVTTKRRNWQVSNKIKTKYLQLETSRIEVVQNKLFYLREYFTTYDTMQF